MKLSTKPISSPGRREKFPPPLMRFLRSNVGSRSRGRSRSSPLFMRKKNTPIETQEPSSPKVTCMGQVRIRRSSKQAVNRPGRTRGPTEAAAPEPCLCKWTRNALFCHHLSGKIKPKSCGPVWRKWVLFFQVGFRRKSEIRQESSKIASKFGNTSEYSEEEDEEEDENEREAKVFDSSCSLPPKNALLLTRCKSAPYRSSSLASRLWGSPLMSEETGEEEQRTKLENRQVNEKKTTSEMESISDQEAIAIVDPKIEEKLGFFKQLEDSSRQRIVSKSAISEEEESKIGEGGVGSARLPILTRCKSEPARIAVKKLDPESSFWKQTRLGVVDSCSTTVL